MAVSINLKYLSLGLVLISLVCVASLGGFLAYSVLFDRQVAYYPGSTQLSSHDVIKVIPRFYYRQDTAYLTGDDFPSVYRWYSNGFGLGPEATGQSNCISMFNTQTTFRITKVMTVTICDTPNGRMVFTQRSLRLEQR